MPTSTQLLDVTQQAIETGRKLAENHFSAKIEKLEKLIKAQEALIKTLDEDNALKDERIDILEELNQSAEARLCENDQYSMSEEYEQK